MAEDRDDRAGRARHVLALRQTEGGEPDDPWRGFSLREEVRLAEGRFIRLALEESGGRVTPAARLLGLNYQSLIALLNERHRELLPLRSPPVPRRRGLLGREGIPPPPRSRAEAKEPPSLLLAARGEPEAALLRRALEAEGWSVDLCLDGDEALRKLEGPAGYDLLIFGGEMSDSGGFELTRRARSLPQRRRTPVVVIAAGEREREAWAAGADAFLREPEEVGEVARTVRRLAGRRGRR